MLNTFLADQIVGAIEAHPEKHSQEQWGLQTSCGTTMCVAGWAVHLSGAQLLFKELHGNKAVAYDCKTEDGVERNIEEYAAELLGLNPEQTNAVFYNMNNDLDVIKNIFKDIANGGTGYVEGRSEGD